MVAVLADGVSKRYEDTWALRDLSLRVDDGEAVVLLGPTGSGKTTLLRLIAGLERPTSGNILFDGVPAADSPEDRNVGMLFAENRLFPTMSARSNIGFSLAVRRVPEPERSHRVEAEAAALKIQELLERMPGSLSAGQASLVQLAGAMVRVPAVFLIDEPLAAVDAKTRRSLRRELRNVQQGYGATAIYATHDHDDAMTLGDRIAVLREGSIRQIGHPTEVYRRPADRFVALFLGNPEMSMLECVPAQGGVAVGDLKLACPPGTGGSLVVGVRPEEWESSGTGLEATVTGVRDLGVAVYVSAASAAGEIVVRWAGSPPEPGTTLKMRPRSYHLFDEASGRAVYHS